MKGKNGKNKLGKYCADMNVACRLIFIELSKNVCTCAALYNTRRGKGLGYGKPVSTFRFTGTFVEN